MKVQQKVRLPKVARRSSSHRDMVYLHPPISNQPALRTAIYAIPVPLCCRMVWVGWVGLKTETSDWNQDHLSQNGSDTDSFQQYNSY